MGLPLYRRHGTRYFETAAMRSLVRRSPGL
jgi:hypothetical protein